MNIQIQNSAALAQEAVGQNSNLQTQLQKTSALTRTNNLDLSSITGGGENAQRLNMRNFDSTNMAESKETHVSIDKNSVFTKVDAHGNAVPGQFGHDMATRNYQALDVRQYSHTQNPQSPLEEKLGNKSELENRSSFANLETALQRQNLSPGAHPEAIGVQPGVAHQRQTPQNKPNIQEIGDHLGSGFTPLGERNRVEKVSDMLLQRPNVHLR